MLRVVFAVLLVAGAATGWRTCEVRDEAAAVVRRVGVAVSQAANGDDVFRVRVEGDALVALPPETRVDVSAALGMLHVPLPAAALGERIAPGPFVYETTRRAAAPHGIDASLKIVLRNAAGRGLVCIRDVAISL